MTLSYSPLAKRAQNMRPLTDATLRDDYGACVHTTGGGITEEAKKLKKTPIEVAINWYRESQNGANKMPNGKPYFWGGPTYVIEHNGTVWQLAPEEVLTNHCGGPNRNTYRTEGWEKKVPAALAAKWHATWGPRFNDPYDLFPSTSPNADYFGIEIIPCGDGFGEPRSPGEKFTRHAYEALIDLLRDIGTRHSWPAGWWRGPRLVGHEDVDPIMRCDKVGGWDPGFLRPGQVYFDFNYVRNSIT